MARFHDTASRSRLTSTRRSHLLGFTYFAHRALQLAASPGDEFAGTFLRDTSRSVILHAPRWPLFVFLFGACCCLLISATCHTLCCVSKRVNARGWRYDYAGICLLIAGSFFPPISYAFFCVPRVRVFYLALISASAAATLVLCVAERFAGHAWRAVRAATFAALGGFGIVPIIHQSLFMWRPSSLPPTLVRANLYELLMGFFYLLGAYLYARRLPERWRPGAFDYFFHSHNIFHFLVVAAALVHLHACLLLLQWRDQTRCPDEGHRSWGFSLV